ncbi:MAG: Gfo/Idh/MocA family oxidoreductase [Cyanobacteria bacterium SIG27]|nr:Gfo/Idh/MocA family oxidoreductase [Cyanobacteria bacterium SIG27]
MKKCTAVVGCGLWGRNIVRNFYNLGALHSVCDLDKENLKMIQELYPDVETTSDFNGLLSNPDIKALCIVTPSHTHFNLVKKAILAGKHVYVEKPISTSAKEALELKDLAEEMNVKLLVGHLLLYHPAVNRLKMLIAQGVLGEIKYVQSDRLNINYFKNDRSVMWDLAPHDVSMIAHVTGKAPLRVLNAVGADTEFENICDITHLTIEFEDGVIGQVSDSWIHPQKRVSLLVRGTKATAILDDTIQEGKLKVYDNKKGSQNEIEVFDYLEIEPLKLECQHFLSCIENDKTPRSDGENGYMIVKILEQAEAMMLGADKAILDNHEFKLSRSK